MKKLIFIFMMLFSWQGNCQWTPIWHEDVLVNPNLTSDNIRSLVTSVESLLVSASEPNMEATLNVTQEETAASLDGDESYKTDTGTGEAGSGLSTITYDYINTTILKGSSKTPYTPLNNKLSSSDLKSVVKEMFFIADEKSATEEKQAEILQNRTDYLTEISKYYVRLAYNVQQKLISDMDSISADVNGNGSIGATAGADQTWHAINRALIADVALQIQLMELDAAKFLSIQPLVLMSEKAPTTSTSTSTGTTTE